MIRLGVRDRRQKPSAPQTFLQDVELILRTTILWHGPITILIIDAT